MSEIDIFHYTSGLSGVFVLGPGGIMCTRCVGCVKRQAGGSVVETDTEMPS